MSDVFFARTLVILLAAALGGCAAALHCPPAVRNLSRLPRAVIPGIVLTLLCWTWITVMLVQHPLGLLPFLTAKMTIIGGIVCAAGCCILLQNLLCARAVGGLLMLWPMPVIVAVRDQLTLWRLVPVSIGYISLTLGMFIVFHPWIFRVICTRLAERPRLRTAASALLLLAGALTLITAISLGKVVGE